MRSGGSHQSGIAKISIAESLSASRIDWLLKIGASLLLLGVAITVSGLGQSPQATVQGSTSSALFFRNFDMFPTGSLASVG
ncbi:MAG TPA: hypothetical protein VFA17_10390, partial [Thermoplasmata archaeon]|nr:hypothetical protein [Thermoplasmata archaeon]